jgi:hypothetical protein
MEIRNNNTNCIGNIKLFSANIDKHNLDEWVSATLR